MAFCQLCSLNQAPAKNSRMRIFKQDVLGKALMYPICILPLQLCDYQNLIGDMCWRRFYSRWLGPGPAVSLALMGYNEGRFLRCFARTFHILRLTLAGLMIAGLTVAGPTVAGLMMIELSVPGLTRPRLTRCRSTRLRFLHASLPLPGSAWMDIAVVVYLLNRSVKGRVGR
jgi:hypothetical protein